MSNNSNSSQHVSSSDYFSCTTELWEKLQQRAKLHYGEISTAMLCQLGGNPCNPLTALGKSCEGIAFMPAVGYNNKGEVVQANHNNNAFDKSYDFDGIGNRKKTADSLTLPAANNYVSNALNQYSNVNGVARTYDDDGNSTTGVVSTRGQLGEIKWNGNNRLTEVTTADGKLVKVDYDHMGRRFRKSVTTGGETKYTYWICADYEAIAKYQKVGSGALELNKTYYWGLGIGIRGDGTGCLLAEHAGTESLFSVFDANGNVTEYLDSTGGVVAHFEYDSYGQTLISNGSKKNLIDHRFSTRAVDRDLGLIYYNYRYLNVRVGRWLKRDSIAESGGLNLYAFNGNDGITAIDSLGLMTEAENKAMFEKMMNGGKKSPESDRKIDTWYDPKTKTHHVRLTAVIRPTKELPSERPKGVKISWVAVLDCVNGTLDVVGMIPVVGEFADGANGIIYLARGDLANASLSAAAMIPFIGNGVTATKYAAKYGDDALAAARKAKQALDNKTIPLDKIPCCKNSLPTSKITPFGPKIADKIPTNGVPKNWSKDDVLEAITDYENSINSRKNELSVFDIAGKGSVTQRKAHARRISLEESFLKTLKKAVKNR